MFDTSSSPDINFGSRVSRKEASLADWITLLEISAKMESSVQNRVFLSLSINNGIGIACMFLIGNFCCTAPTVPLAIASLPNWDRRYSYKYSGVICFKFVTLTQFSVRLALSKVESTIAVKPIVPTIEIKTSPVETM